MDIDLEFLLSLALIAATLLSFLHKPSSPISVAEIAFYPVKSCAGIKLQTAIVDESGIKFDRLWAIVNENREIVSSAVDPRLLRIEPELLLTETGEPHALILRHVDKEFRLQVEPTLATPSFEAMRYPRLAQSEGPAVAAFLKEILHSDYTLVRFTGPQFKDALHCHITSQESISDFRADLDKKQCFDMDAFPTNFIVEGCPAYDEDTWAEFRMAGIRMLGVIPCRHSSKLATEDSAQYIKKPTFRAVLSEEPPKFGIWCVRRDSGVISVGDRVTVTKRT